MKLVEKDLTDFGISYEQNRFTKIAKQKLKIIAANAAFNKSLEKQSTPKKLKQIASTTLEVQLYLKIYFLTQK